MATVLRGSMIETDSVNLVARVETAERVISARVRRSAVLGRNHITLTRIICGGRLKPLGKILCQ